MFKRQNEEKILAWIQNDDLVELSSYLLSGTVHGKPGVPVAELGRIEKIIKKNIPDLKRYTLAKKLLQRPEYTARNIGTQLIVGGWPANGDVELYAKKAANDPEWIVREYAAGAFAALLEKDFAHFSKTYLKWVKSESINVKRAIALAVKYESKSAKPKRCKTYLAIIDPLMSEEAEYIRKNLGPFTIGDGLLPRFPNEVLASCKRWMKSENENVRWNTAMIFTAAAARKFSKEGKEVLLRLEKDESQFVARAAKKAQKNLGR
jgi:hypothetical protein